MAVNDQGILVLSASKSDNVRDILYFPTSITNAL